MVTAAFLFNIGGVCGRSPVQYFVLGLFLSESDV